MTRKGAGVLRRLLIGTRVGLWGGVLVGLVTMAAVLAPLIAPYNPYRMNSREMLSPPSAQHLLGTDNYGRDVLARVIYGSRVSLYVGMMSVAICLAIGAPLGLIAGCSKRLDNPIMRTMDVLFSFPPILLAIVIVAVLGPGLTNSMIAIGITGIPRLARLTRSQAISVAGMDYVSAAVAIGCSRTRVIVFHILRNSTAILVVQASVMFAGAILAEAALSFLGLGAQPPAASWGAMLSQARLFLEIAPWLSIFPGVAIMISVLGFNFLGDGLRDVLDPTLRR